MSQSRLTDWLPMELWHHIADTDERTYRAMLAFPEFARSLTPSVRMDHRVALGHSVHLTSLATWWVVRGEISRLDGPALQVVGLLSIHASGSTAPESWLYNGWRHRVGGPAETSLDGTRRWFEHGELLMQDFPVKTGIFWNTGACIEDVSYGRIFPTAGSAGRRAVRKARFHGSACTLLHQYADGTAYEIKLSAPVERTEGLVLALL